MEKLPARLFVCPICQYRTEYRWVLAQHLSNVHNLGKRQAKQVAAENEYWANPVTYHRVNDNEPYEDEDEEI